MILFDVNLAEPSDQRGPVVSFITNGSHPSNLGLAWILSVENCLLENVSQMTHATLHGIHSLPITDAVLDGMRMSMWPGTSDSHIKDYLSKIVLVELEVTGLRGEFDPYEIRQKSKNTTDHHYQDHVFLDAEGTAMLSEHGYDLPDGVTHFRIAIYVRHYNLNEALLTPFETFPPSTASEMPLRLKDLTIFSCD